MNFICVKPSLLQLFFHTLTAYENTCIRLNSCTSIYNSLTQKIGYSGEKKINEFSIFVANSK